MADPPARRRLSVAIVVREALVRIGLTAALGDSFAVLSASTVAGASRLMAQHQPDRAIVGLSLPFPDATLEETCAALMSPRSATPVLALVRPNDSTAVRLAAKYGARAIFDTLVPASALRAVVSRLDFATPVVQPSLVRHLVDGADEDGTGPAPSLRPRELAVIQLLARGFTSKQIATALQTTPKAVDLLIERASRRLGATHRAQAVAIATRRGLLT